MTLPDCPHCDAAGTLEPVGTEGHGTKVYECSCCSKRCRVNADGVVVWPRLVERDVHGNMIYGD